MLDVSKYIDAYTVRARLLPGLLAFLPIAVTCYAWSPGGLLDWNGLGVVISGLGGTVLLAFIARDLGKRAEERLYELWGGRPTELLLMHSGEMDPALRARRHAALNTFFKDMPVPTAAEEANDRPAAQKRFKTLTGLMIGRYRLVMDKYPLVFEENCNYGFRRNLYGLRPLGVAISLITSIALGLHLHDKFASHQTVAVISLIFEAINVFMLLAWIFWVNEATVRRGANLYAERLFETLDMTSPPAQHPIGFRN